MQKTLKRLHKANTQAQQRPVGTNEGATQVGSLIAMQPLADPPANTAHVGLRERELPS